MTAAIVSPETPYLVYIDYWDHKPPEQFPFTDEDTATAFLKSAMQRNTYDPTIHLKSIQVINVMGNRPMLGYGLKRH